HESDCTPFFGVDVSALAPGAVAAIDGATLGYPVASLKDIPAGDYYVQALFERVHRVSPRRRAHALAARRPVGRPAVQQVTGEPGERRAAGPPRPAGGVRGSPRAGARAAADRAAARHPLGEA